MMTNKKVLVPCQFGPQQVWKPFCWDKYPQGVMVTVALVDGINRLLLERVGRWGFSLPSFRFQEHLSLANMPSKFTNHMHKKGVSVQVQDDSVRTIGLLEDGDTLRVLILAQANVIGPRTEFDYVNSALVLGGYGISNVMSTFLPQVLGWKDASNFAERLAA